MASTLLWLLLGVAAVVIVLMLTGVIGGKPTTADTRTAQGDPTKKLPGAQGTQDKALATSITGLVGSMFDLANTVFKGGNPTSSTA